MTPAPKFLTATEAARKLSIRLDTLYCLLRIGRIASERKNGRWFVSADAVEERMRLLGKSDNSSNPSRSFLQASETSHEKSLSQKPHESSTAG